MNRINLKNIAICGLLLISWLVTTAADTHAQDFEKTKAAVLTPATTPDGEKVYIIRLSFQGDITSEQEAAITDSTSWQVNGEKITYRVTDVRYNPLAKKVSLFGNWGQRQNLTVLFRGEQAITVNSSGDEESKWDFGTGSSVEMNIRRLTDVKSRFAFDHNLEVKIAERNLSMASDNLWLRSFSLNLESEGVITADPQVRDGSKTKLELAANPYYFAGGTIYRAELSTGLQVETALDTASNDLIDVQNSRFKVGLELEVPYSNYPMLQLHKKTGYPRLAMPLTLGLDYIGKEDNEPGRIDAGAMYELAFSPYLILRGEWHYSKFSDPVPTVGDDASYYAVSIAQDLTEATGVLKVLKYVTTLGLVDEDSEARNFIFFKISKGRKAPAFRDLTERSFGFGVYF